MPLNYLELEKSRQQERLRKSYFTNNFIEKMANIFINYKKHVNYKFALKLRHNKRISTLKDLFK